MLTDYIAAAVVEYVRGIRRLVFTDEADYRREVAETPVGLRLSVSFKEEEDPGTDLQRKYWFAVPVPLCADFMGQNDKDTSRDLMAECFGYETNRFGRLVPIETSFAALTKKKRQELIDWVLDWAPRTLNVFVPPPDKNWRDHADTIRRQRRGAN